MKFIIKKEILLENLNNVGRALSNRNIIPIINGILFELTDEGLYLTATDNEITIKSFIDKSKIISIKETGKNVIYGKFLLDIIRKIEADDITVEEVDGGKIIISTLTSNYSLNCLDANDFPKINIDLSDKVVILTGDNFKKMINQTVFATSLQESKPLLTGVNIKIQGNLLESIATDSYRLAKKAINFNDIFKTSINMVVPARNINEFVKIIENGDENIEIHAFPTKVLFKYKDLYFQSSLLNGSYPNTDSLVPNNFETIYKINLNEFYNIIDRASILASAKDKNIISLETIDNKLIVTSSSLEIGKIEEVMNIEVIKGSNIKISFSSKYMLEALKSFESENIIIYFNGDVKPIIIKEKDDGELLQLILPIKTY